MNIPRLEGANVDPRPPAWASTRAGSLPERAWRASSLTTRSLLLHREVKFEGYLEKRDQGGAYVRRFCVLDNGEFRFFAEEAHATLPDAPLTAAYIPQKRGSGRRGSAGPGSSDDTASVHSRMIGSGELGGRSRSSSEAASYAGSMPINIDPGQDSFGARLQRSGDADVASRATDDPLVAGQRVVPLEDAMAVRTVRREQNCFMLVLPNEQLEFRAPSRELYQEWLFQFHSSILAVAMRIRDRRGVDRRITATSRRNLDADAPHSAETAAPGEVHTPATEPRGLGSLDGAAMRRLPTRDITVPSDERGALTGDLSRSPELGHGHGHEYYASEGHPLRRQPAVDGHDGGSSLLASSFSTASATAMHTSAGVVSSSASELRQPSASSSVAGGSLFDRSAAGVGGSYSGKSSLAESLMAGNQSSASPRSPNVPMPMSALTPPRSSQNRGPRSASNQSASSSFDSMKGDSPSRSPSLGAALSLKDASGSTAADSPLSGTSPRGGIFLGNLAGGRSSPGQRERRGSGSSAGSNLGGMFDLSLEETDFSLVVGAPREAAEEAASVALVATSRMMEGIASSVPRSPEESAGTAGGAHRWRSGAYCSRGVRAKNEDTYFVSDDVAAGGYSSSAPGDFAEKSKFQRGNSIHVNGIASADGSWSRASGCGGGIRTLDYSQGAVESTARNSFSPIAPLSQTLQQDCLGFFAVYDGHCGAECAAMASDELHNDIFSHDAFQTQGDAATQVPGSVSEALRDAFLAFDARYLERAKRESLYSGSTAVAALLCAQGRKLFIANLGDSAAIICRRRGSEEGGAGGGGLNAVTYEAVHVTQAHKPDRPDEQQRVQAAGGWLTEERELFMGQLHRMDLDDPEIVSAAEDVVQWVTIARVCGELAVSRSFGDPDFKGFSPDSHAQAPGELFFPFPEGHDRSFKHDLVLAEPEIHEHDLQRGRDDFLVLASDGVWDVLNGQQVVDAISRFQVRHRQRFAQLSAHFEQSAASTCLHNDSAGPHGDPPINLEELAEDITRLALRLGSADNVTVVCVAFE
jgi:serine/threonine protein phosphatase PrpC